MNDLVDKVHAEETLRLTQSILDDGPVRLTGTPACRKAAERIRQELEKWSDTVSMEAFEVHPGSFLSFTKVLAVLYALSALLLFFGGIGVYAAAALLAFGSFFALTQFVFYWETFDRLHRRATGYNVIARIDPTGEVKRQIIVAGHHDSAYVFNFLVRWQKLYVPRIASGLVMFALALVSSWAWVVHQLGTGADLPFAAAVRIAIAAGLALVAPLYFFKGNEGSPGAGDNLVASAIGIKLAELFGGSKKTGEPLLQHTRLIVLSTDSEEAGLRGARNYVKRHKEELLALPTFVFNIESLYRIDQLKLFSRDINGIVRLSHAMAEECRAHAADLGYRATVVPIPFGGGATDAAEFAKAGVCATTILAMNTDLIRDGLVYHTLDDTVDRIEPEAVEAVLKIACRYILGKDAEIGGHHT